MRNLLALAGLLAIVTGLAAAVYFFGGFFDVSTTAREPALVRKALIAVRMASVSRHATATPPANLASEANWRAGARAYHDHGCVNCHGAPGVEWARFSEGLRPDPPDLLDLSKHRTPAELFHVVKNGINMTGMPGFGAAPDPELWAIVAFVKKLPDVTDEQFKAWSGMAAAAKP